jgi:hypothetical protein
VDEDMSALPCQCTAAGRFDRALSRKRRPIVIGTGAAA